jgi:hypothetical protein
MKEKEEEKRVNGEGLVKGVFIVFTAIIISFMFLGVFSAVPGGVSGLNITSNETGSVISSGNAVNISGGYIATINITTSVQNPHWKAFVGWVNGAFTLDDSSGSTIYDWSLATTEGEVYATRDSATVEWGTITCATNTEIETENVAMNLSNPSDNITATFSDTTHNSFYVGSTNIGANSCPTLNTYVSNSSQDTTFEEIALHDETSIVYATIIEDQSQGFDENSYDFQMIVPEYGLEGFSGSTAYFIYVEVS